MGDRRCWIVYKFGLRMFPCIGEFVSLLLGQHLDVEFLDALFPFLQDFLSLTGVAFRSRNPTIFRAELGAELFCAPAADIQPDSDHD